MPRDFEVATPAQIRELFAYSPDSGALARLASKRSDTVGDVPTIKSTGGYLVVYALGRLFRAHRLAWVLMTGEWPTGDIDHINRDRTDNRWANLRAATRAQNLRNATVDKRSKSGLKGVAPHGDRFVAYIRLDGKKQHLGSFDTAEEAHARYCEESRKHFGEFASDGKPPNRPSAQGDETSEYRLWQALRRERAGRQDAGRYRGRRGR